MAELERLCLTESSWAVYERHESDDEWEFCDTHHAEDPGTAARVVAAMKWAGGKHFMLAVGLRGAYEYMVTLDTKGPSKV